MLSFLFLMNNVFSLWPACYDHTSEKCVCVVHAHVCVCVNLLSALSFKDFFCANSGSFLE